MQFNYLSADYIDSLPLYRSDIKDNGKLGKWEMDENEKWKITNGCHLSMIDIKLPNAEKLLKLQARKSKTCSRVSRFLRHSRNIAFSTSLYVFIS